MRPFARHSRLGGEAIELVDVAAGADDLDAFEAAAGLFARDGGACTEGGYGGAHFFPLRLRDGAVEEAERADVEGAAVDELDVGDEGEFGAAAAQVHVEEVLGCGGVAMCRAADEGGIAVAENTGLFVADDDFDVEFEFFAAVAQNLLAVLGVAEGGCGAGAVVLYFVEDEEVAEHLHRADKHRLAFLADAADILTWQASRARAEDVDAEAERDAQELQFLGAQRG